MRALIEEHGGAVVTAAIVLILIGLVVAWGKTDAAQTMFSGLIEKFTASASEAAGFQLVKIE